MAKRTGFYCIRGNDLDRLEPRDFKVIFEWLKGIAVSKKRKSPQPHQAEALKAILDSFNENDRTTVLMACGTGKTLVALWAAERMGCKKILVLVPSLALLSQTLHEWFRETHWEQLAHLCVCSDPSVSRGTDDIIIKQQDLDFPVTTESKIVREFLERNYDGIKVVFSTYQSSFVVAEGMDKNDPFDLGIFDEAHKTAGREGTKLTFRVF